MDSFGNQFKRFEHTNNEQGTELGDLIISGFKEYKEEQQGNILNPIKKVGMYAAAGLLAANLFLGIGCKKADDYIPPPDRIYNITTYVKEIREGFPELKGSEINIANQIIRSGETITYQGNVISINATGGHDNVLVLRGGYNTGEISFKDNISQSQNGEPLSINLGSLDEKARHETNIILNLYKIPSDIPINDVKEALVKGTAVYDKPVTFYPVNEGYSEEQYKKVIFDIIPKVNNILEQLNTIPGMKGCYYDPNKTSGNQRIRLSPKYHNAGHAESGSGIMSASEIKIADYESTDVFLEELYQAMGVRHDIGIDDSIRDDISGYTDTLNQFGRDLMIINYFLEPETTL